MYFNPKLYCWAPIQWNFKSTRTVLIARAVDPSTAFLMYIVEPSILLCSMVLMCAVDPSDILFITLFISSPLPNSTSGTYGLCIGTVKLTKWNVTCTH